MPSLRSRSGTASSKARIQNVSTAQTVKTGGGTLRRIVLSNSGAAATLTLLDGATTLNVLNVAANTVNSTVLALDVPFTTSLILTPSNASVDALVMYD